MDRYHRLLTVIKLINKFCFKTIDLFGLDNCFHETFQETIQVSGIAKDAEINRVNLFR